HQGYVGDPVTPSVRTSCSGHESADLEQQIVLRACNFKLQERLSAPRRHPPACVVVSDSAARRESRSCRVADDAKQPFRRPKAADGRRAYPLAINWLKRRAGGAPLCG